MAKHGGVGINLFFMFLKWSAIAFYLMAIIALPAIYSNYKGNGISNY